MAKKTNLQIYEEWQVHADVVNNPYRTPPDFQTLYQNMRLKWFKLKAKDFEVSETVRADLRPFIREKDFGNVSEVFLKKDGIKIEYITAVHGDWKFQCNGKNTVRQLPIAPKAIDVVNAIMNDPFQQPVDTDPMYVEQNGATGIYLKILSTTTPDRVTVHYLKEPDQFDLVDNPEGFTEEEEMQQNEILDMVLGRNDIIVENFNRAQAFQNEVQSKGV